MKKNKNMLFRLVGAILCVAMLLSFVACANSADDETESISDVETETEPVETMKVAVFSLNSMRGHLLNKYRVELKDVPVTDLPVDPITNLDDVIGKYLLEDTEKGSCVSYSMLSLDDPLVSSNGLGEDYVILTDIIDDNPDIKDVSDVIQKAIDENPGKTIYVPDGKYDLSRTIVIPSDPAKSVSFRLSNYATFSPGTSWTSESTALVQYGTPESSKTQSGDHSDYFMGGILDVERKGTAIAVYGGGRLFINNVSIKNAKIGIHLNSNAAYNDIENVNVTCQTSSGSKGIFVEGTNNSFVNMRIYHPFIGAHLTGGDNVLINIHPLGNPSGNISSAGFYDQSTGNRYSICYSDQYPVGFKIESQTRSYFDMCYMYWWQGCAYQIGFMCVGEFNSIISDTTVSMQKPREEKDGGTENHYLYFIEADADEEEIPEDFEENADNQQGERPGKQESGNGRALTSGTPKGSGIIINPTIQYSKNSDSTTYKLFLFDPNK